MPSSLRDSRPGRVTAGVLLALAVSTLVAMVVLWPGDAESVTIAGIAGESEGAEVVAMQQLPCPGAEAEVCSRIEVELDASGETVAIDLGAAAFNPEVSVGDSVRVAATGGGGAPETYTLVDFERRGPMLWLAAAFVALVVGFGRLRGAMSLVGLLASLAIILLFIVPAIEDGAEPVIVAIVGAIAVMLVTIPLAHGFGVKSASAMLGTVGSLIGIALLALIFVELAHLTGFASEEATLLAGESSLSVQGLLLAGMVIAALGVLDDVTVSQASTVLALRSANPSMTQGELFRRAIEVGRDHITATVNTLVLAYVGASLPVLLIFSAGGVGFGEAANSEIVASEIVATLVGSIGLIAAVPLTTWLTARLATSLPAESAGLEPAGHHH